MIPHAERCETWQAGLSELSGFDDCWVAFDQGLVLLDETYHCGASGEVLVALLSGINQMRLQVRGNQQADALLAQRLIYCEQQVEELLRDTGISKEQQASQLQAKLLVLDQLELMLEVGSDAAGHLEGDLRRLRREISRFALDERGEGEELVGQALGLQVQLLGKQVDHELQEIERIEQGPERPNQLWYHVSCVESLREGCLRTGCLERQIELLDGSRSGLLGDLLSTLDGMSGEGRRDWIDRTSAEEIELVEELLTQIEDQPLLIASDNLERARERVEFLAAHRPPGGTQSTGRTLARYRRRLFNEWVDKTIHCRLEKRFGGRFVSVLENTVLLLIMAVCTLLLGEMVWELTNHDVRRLAYLDAAICGVLLFEFFLKLSYSPARINYFLRHSLIDLLPSIPFGLFAVWAGVVSQTGAAASHVTAVRAARLARLPRLARYIRVARPLIQVLRVAIFSLRGMDRVVRRYGSLINRNIVFFDPVEEGEQRDLQYRVNTLQLKVRGVVRAVSQRLTSGERRRLLVRRVKLVGARLELFDIHAGVSHRGPQLGHLRDIRVEQVIEALTRLDADGLEEQFGAAFTRRVARVTQVASLPVLRRLPLLRDVARARSVAEDDTDLLTRSAHALGRGMERLLSTLYWLSDLYGVISASLLIDRLGAAIAKTTERPAKRLLILGLVMALLTGLASIVPGLRTLATTVETFLGLPIIILGILCFMSLILGRWFQRVAGQAGDFYERAAEAQFLGLIKLVKRTSMKEHEELLERRILIPEAKLTGRSRPTTRAATRMHFAERMAAVMDERGKVEPGEVAERVALLYRHYLDGAPLHRSGSTTTNQLLGNLVIDNIRRERLKLKRKELKSLLKLDLERSRSILGPYLWFNFITLAVAQRTARLIVEYNIHSVPLEERELYCAEELTAVDSWLDRRRESADRTERPKKIDLIYRTTAFTAIDFLTRDPERDRMIQQKFGEELSAQLMQDRRQLIREVFGTFPFSRWPKARRSINLYDLYWCHLGGARAVLFPLAMAWKALRLQAFLLGRLLRTLRDLLSPQRGLAIRETAVASYDVAQRKINRMRKPMFMEATRLRARFDVEYMGLFLPGKRTSGLELQGYEQDLRFIGALKEEEDGYIEIRRAHRRSLQTLAALMRIEGWEDDGMATWMAEQNPALASREREALRACAVAYAIDYQSVCSLTELELSIRRGLNQAVASQGKLAVGRLRSARGSLMRGLFCWTPRSVMRRRAFDRYWTANCSGRPDEERDYCRRYALADTQGLGRRILQARKHDDVPLAKVREIVQRICRNPTTWTDQLLTLRTVQSLALLDVFSDRQIVRDLGEYEDSTEPPRPVVLPRL